MEILINNKIHSTASTNLKGIQLKEYIDNELGLNSDGYYLLNNGKRIEDDHVIPGGSIHVVPKVFGGKGGFGSMLRAIGAQIEKTTNREACRDLSGRRLRDINEEQRLKNWINQQAEREKEAKERKKKKLERLCERPKHEFKDEVYDKERSELPEKVEDALLQGLQASCSTKRKSVDKKDVVKKKKAKLWVGDDLDEDLSSSGDENESDVEGSSKSNSVKLELDDSRSSHANSASDGLKTKFSELSKDEAEDENRSFKPEISDGIKNNTTDVQCQQANKVSDKKIEYNETKGDEKNL
ncbi:hypothetical protein NQ317_004577 [Molorchus minor]|uniref:SDE2-like domain-containing protein n=1 Tax=Molorchus minor TaxID=1323400 RepID=A0ABQ9JX52_9CUCU|nr:hypothetical protein NQ317_004577 [Molorchus minor]